MARMNKSSNPALREKIFERESARTIHISEEGTMSVKGTLNKFLFIFAMAMCTSVYSWFAFEKGQSVAPMIMIGAFGGLGLAILMSFKMKWSKYLAPAYGLCEGLFLGAISAMFSQMFAEKAPYIVIQAVLLTFGVVLTMWTLYRTRVIKVTNRLRMIIVGATGGIFVFYLLTWVLGFFGVNIPFMSATNGSTFGIIFSLVVVGVAALNLLLDFDMIEKGSQMGAPKYMEWYCAFGLMVTIVWLYIEILRLLSRLNSR
ncbi:MAG TPA: Bax inhibitor-1/YccA family protein [Chitinophagaceae bacterium]|nr:Bax inhibitor-1/YccA family protein [Chitinophagaceae bacterium]